MQTTIRIPKYRKEELIKQAIKSYNRHHSKRDGFHASIRSNPLFLKRIAINYLRHECTAYDWKLRGLSGGELRNAHDKLKAEIDNKIIETYPWLKDGLKHTDYK